MNMDTHMSGSTVKNHISFKMVFEYSVVRKISYQSWFLAYLQPPQARLLQHRRLLEVRKLTTQITIQQSSQVKVWIDKYRETRILLKHQNSCWINQPKSKNQRKRGSWTGTEKPVFRHTRKGFKNLENFGGWQSSWTQRLALEFFSWTIFRTCEKCGFG